MKTRQETSDVTYCHSVGVPAAPQMGVMTQHVANVVWEKRQRHATLPPKVSTEAT